VEAEGKGGGSRSGGVEAAGNTWNPAKRLPRADGYVEVELQPWKLTVRAVAPAVAAGRRLESGEEMSSGSRVAVKSRWNFNLGT